MNAEVGQAAQLRFVSPDICDYVQQTNEQIVPILEGTAASRWSTTVVHGDTVIAFCKAMSGLAG